MLQASLNLFRQDAQGHDAGQEQIRACRHGNEAQDFTQSRLQVKLNSKRLFYLLDIGER